MAESVADRIALEDIASLDAATLRGWHERHLPPERPRGPRPGGHAAADVARARGPFLHPSAGRRLLDLVSCYGGLNHGHNHPSVVAAARWFDEQELPDLVKEFPSRLAAVLAHNLACITPDGLEAVFFCNSGTEAVEGALKLAFRAHAGKRDRIVYAENSLHGKTLGSLSVTGRDKYRASMPRFDRWPMVPFGDAAALEAVFAADTERTIAALILEPIQGEGGVVVPPAGYLATARRLTERHGALLILDEIQTGFGRTGTMFRCQAEGVTPDVLCLAKSLGGGVATIGATVTTRALRDRAYGRMRESLVHTSTFGGRGRACAAAIAALKVAVDDDYPRRARDLGTRLAGELRAVAQRHPDRIVAVRGEGLMLGIEFAPPRLTGLATLFGSLGLNRAVDAWWPGIIGAELLRHDIVASFVLNHPRVLRIYPALVATEEDLAAIPRALDAVLARGVNETVSSRVAAAAATVGTEPIVRWVKES